jgi:hypothetical protein
MSSETTIARAFSWTLALGASAGSLSFALLLLVGGDDDRALPFLLGAVVLGAWAATHLTAQTER